MDVFRRDIRFIAFGWMSRFCLGLAVLVPAHSAAGQKACLCNIQGGTIDNETMIDVMVLYTPSAAAKIQEDTSECGENFFDVDAAISSMIQRVNVAFGNSGIDESWHEVRLVHSGQIAFDESNHTVSMSRAALQNPSDGIMDGVQDLRDNYAADIVCVLVDRPSDPATGKSFTARNLGTNPDGHPEEAYFVVTAALCPEVLRQNFAHELGHCLGCQHERGQGPDVGAFPKSHAYVAPGAAFGTIMTDVGDSNDWIPYYSNPAETYNTAPTGCDGTCTSPNGNSSDSTNNAESIIDAWNIIANYRPSCWNDASGGVGFLNACTDINKNCVHDFFELGGEPFIDADGNGAHDAFEFEYGCRTDCDGDGVPDVADEEHDCNNNGVFDDCEPDCDGNGFPDDASCPDFIDCNNNGIPDSCEVVDASNDCDGNGIVDSLELCGDCPTDASGAFIDENKNDILDSCESTSPECIADFTTDIPGCAPFTKDGRVGIADFLAVLDLWGPQPPGQPGHAADFIKCTGAEDSVGIFEFLEVLSNWCPEEECCGKDRCDEGNNQGSFGCTAEITECQLRERMALHGSDLTPGGVSDVIDGGTGVIVRHADDFISNTGGVINQICWWGYYQRDDGSDCFDEGITSDNFTIRIYGSAISPSTHLPAPDDANVLATFQIGDAFGIETISQHQVDPVTLHQYTAILPTPFTVLAGQCYWIEIVNDTSSWSAADCHWYWAWSDDGNGSSVRADSTVGPGYLSAGQLRQDADLSFCIDVGWRAPGMFAIDNGTACFVAIECMPQASDDCNSNGVMDWCDIIRGTSQDHESDGIPDECQIE